MARKKTVKRAVAEFAFLEEGGESERVIRIEGPNLVRLAMAFESFLKGAGIEYTWEWRKVRR